MSGTVAKLRGQLTRGLGATLLHPPVTAVFCSPAIYLGLRYTSLRPDVAFYAVFGVALLSIGESVIDHADMADLDEPRSVKAAFTLIMIVSLNVLFAVAAVLGSLMFTVEPQLAATVALGVPVVDHWLAPRGVPTVMKTTGVVFRGVSRLAAVVEQSLNREPSASDALAAAAASVSEQPDTLITTFTHRVRASVQPWI